MSGYRDRSRVSSHPVGASIGADRLHTDAEMLWTLLQDGFEVDGEAVLCERMTWVIYGRTTYDGEIILAEYENPQDAAHVLRAVADRSTCNTSTSFSCDRPSP
jgi:hypothetical protein